jgi:hypothetical protein
MSRGREAFRSAILSAILLCATLVSIACLAPAQASENASECCAALDAKIAELASAVLDNNVHDGRGFIAFLSALAALEPSGR